MVSVQLNVLFLSPFLLCYMLFLFYYRLLYKSAVMLLLSFFYNIIIPLNHDVWCRGLFEQKLLHCFLNYLFPSRFLLHLICQLVLFVYLRIQTQLLIFSHIFHRNG
jgi:hypothetical protein